MRRRRNAADDEAATLPSSSNNDLPPSEETPAPPAAEAAEVEKPRRRSRKTNPAALAPGDTPPTEEPTEPAPEAAPRARRRRSPAAEAEATAAAEVAPVAQTLPSADDAAPPRPRRRAKVVEAVEPAIQAAIAQAPAEQAETAAPLPAPGAITNNEEEMLLGEAAAPAPPPSARRRGGRRGTPASAAPAGGDETAPSPPIEATAPPADAPPRRTRGVHRSKTATEPAEPAAPLYQALPDETLARLARTRVVVRKGVPELIVNDEPRLPLWFFVNTEDPDTLGTAARQIRAAYDAGVRFFSVLAHLPWVGRSGERRFGPLDEALRFVADHAPDGFLLPRLIFSPPASWERAHPDEMARYENDAREAPGEVSIASRQFWETDAEKALRAAVEHVAEGPHAGRVFGFYLEHGEWFYEKGRGFEMSAPNTQGFRAWLRGHYRNDLVALRAAWHDGAVTFENALVPPAPLAENGESPLFYNERERRYRDFHAYGSDAVAQVITRLGRAVKEASGNRSAVAVSYGYTLELMRAHSGHLALAQVLASPHVDILTGPISYAGRMPGGAAPFPAPIESVALAGKLWVSEDDTKTFLADADPDATPDPYNPRIETASGTAAVHTRNFGAALARGAGVSWMDLWGQGWLDDRPTWEGIGNLLRLSDKLATRRRNPRTRASEAPDVAVIVDEVSFFLAKSDERLLGRLVANPRDALLRSGARVGFYLLSDLALANFPAAPKLLLFLNAFRIPADVRTAIKERLQSEGRTLAWVYGPGKEEMSRTDAAAASDLADVIGMQLRLQPWGSKTGTIVIDNRSPLTSDLRGQRLGDEERINPSFMVADANAQVLGEYAATGNPSLAVRKHALWQSVFIGEMNALSPALLRGLYRLAGVPVYSTDDDVLSVGDGVICLHSTPGGQTPVYLPHEAVLYDLFKGETLAADGRGQRLSLGARETRLLFFGTPTEVARLGGDPKAGPPGLSAGELPAPSAPFAFEKEASPPSSHRAEADEALMRAALAGAAPLVDKDKTLDNDEAAPVADAAPPPAAATVVNGAVPAKKKRRRRRGGRRGRADADGEGTTAAGDAEETDTDEDDEEIDDGVVGNGVVGDNADEADSGGYLPVGGAPSLRLPPADVPAGEPIAARPARPTLSELLPDSETVGSDAALPPVPDELLPLDRLQEDEADAPAETTPRRRRARTRRGNSRGGDDSREATTATPAESAPFDETPDTEAQPEA